MDRPDGVELDRLAKIVHQIAVGYARDAGLQPDDGYYNTHYEAEPEPDKELYRRIVLAVLDESGATGKLQCER